MPGSLFDLVRRQEGPLLGTVADRASPESTPTEAAVVEQALVEDAAALARAEELVQGLPRGHEVFACPGCHFSVQGIRGGPEHATYRSHIKRHAHAYEARALERFTAPRR